MDLSQQQSVEIIIHDQENVKAKNGLLQELCYNYYEVDNEAIGCRVDPPKVQIFYETQSSSMTEILFKHFAELDQYSPFETVMNVEFVPYGKTQFVDGKYTCPQGETQCHANWIHVSTTATVITI